MSTHAEIANALRQGVAADIWFEPQEGEESAAATILLTQGAMESAADLLSAPILTTAALASIHAIGATLANLDAVNESGEPNTAPLADLQKWGGDLLDLGNDKPRDLQAELRELIAAGLTYGNSINLFAEDQRAKEPELAPYIDGAREFHHCDGETEIENPGVIVSKGEDPGAYVLAWVWVTDAQAGIYDPEQRAAAEALGYSVKENHSAASWDYDQFLAIDAEGNTAAFGEKEGKAWAKLIEEVGPFDPPEPEDANCENCGNTDNDGSDICPDCGGAMQ